MRPEYVDPARKTSQVAYWFAVSLGVLAVVSWVGTVLWLVPTPISFVLTTGALIAFFVSRRHPGSE